MEFVLYDNPKCFLEKVAPFLMEKEAVNNLPLGIINRLTKDSASYESPFLGCIEDVGEVQCIMMRTPPHHWILATSTDVSEKSINVMVNYVLTHNLPVPGVLGPREIVERFASKWAEKANVTASVHMEQLIYQLDKVNNISYSPGQLVQAEEKDEKTISQWLYQFGQEANEPLDKEQALDTARRFISGKSIYLWLVDGIPVSMANQSRSTMNGATINAVYTPNEYKRKGYATNAVRALTQQLLDKGYSFCSLYTDLANPTSNTIYKKIGYYPVGDSIVITFNK